MADAVSIDSLGALRDRVRLHPGAEKVVVASLMPQDALAMFDSLRHLSTGHGWQVAGENLRRVAVLSLLDRTLVIVRDVFVPLLVRNPGNNYAVLQLHRLADQVRSLGRRVGGAIAAPTEAPTVALRDRTDALSDCLRQIVVFDEQIDLVALRAEIGELLRLGLVRLDQPPVPEEANLPFDVNEWI
uniref:Uncharacterized protein n=1 Tax=Arundo donax TaxID=35708 RepID=A0A0A9BZ75_ARUDO